MTIEFSVISIVVGHIVQLELRIVHLIEQVEFSFFIGFGELLKTHLKVINETPCI